MQAHERSLVESESSARCIVQRIENGCAVRLTRMEQADDSTSRQTEKSGSDTLHPIFDGSDSCFISRLGLIPNFENECTTCL